MPAYPLICAIATLLLALPAFSADSATTTTIPWQKLEFHASKLFVSGKLSFQLSDIPTDRARTQLLEVKRHQVPDLSGKALSLLRVRSELMSNRGEMRIWMDPQNFRVYQRVRMTSGANTRLKMYRYLQNAVYRVRKESESTDPQRQAVRWRTSSEQLIPMPAHKSGPGYVQDPSALLLLASSQALRNSGDAMTATVFTDKQFYEATLSVVGNHKIDAKYRLEDYSGVRTVAAKLNTVKIKLSTKLLSAGPEEEAFEFLGLNSPVVIYVDPNSQLPLQVEGRQNRVGKVTVDMRKVTLRTE